MQGGKDRDCEYGTNFSRKQTIPGATGVPVPLPSHAQQSVQPQAPPKRQNSTYKTIQGGNAQRVPGRAEGGRAKKTMYKVAASPGGMQNSKTGIDMRVSPQQNAKMLVNESKKRTSSNPPGLSFTPMGRKTSTKLSSEQKALSSQKISALLSPPRISNVSKPSEEYFKRARVDKEPRVRKLDREA